jgi:hypothetical protein
MKVEIRSRWDSTVLFVAEAASTLLAVEAAVKARADLSSADLRDADLSSANLRGADLRDADLRGADLSGADLRGADLRDADLRGADLSSANLRGADLSGADLRGADLRDADLRGADLRGAKNSALVEAKTSIVPEGNIVGWKKCQNGVIVKLLIPQKARRSNATGRKCRAEYATVLRVFGAVEGISQHDPYFIYRKGETVKPTNGWNENRFVECGGGIHFYLTRIEAENH